jgi:hypothetical protein
MSFATRAEITLISFNVKSKLDTAMVTWSTASEVRNAYYVIEKSTDGEWYEVVEQIASEGDLHYTSEYVINDVHPYYGRSYYRLSSVDLDGEKTIHSVTALLLEEPVSFGFSVCPSPVPTEFQLTFKGLKGSESPITVKVLDLNGKIVCSETFKGCQLQKNRWDVQKLSEIEAGTYIIISVHEGEVSRKKILMVR